MFFSIIIPALNEEKYLPKLLGDLARQTYKDFEVIVVDGRSEDKTVTLAQKFSQKFPLTILTSPRRNVSYQRNLGAKHAQGQYLVFFDADNQLPKNCFRYLKKTLKSQTCEVFMMSVRFNSRKKFDIIFSQFFNLLVETAAKTKIPVACGAAIGCRRDVFAKSGGFDQKIRLAEDTCFVRQAVKNNFKFCFIKNTYILYSMRRFKKEGYPKTILKNLLFPLYQSKNPLLEEILQYHMGGTPQKDTPILEVIKKHLEKNHEVAKLMIFLKKVNARLQEDL